MSCKNNCRSFAWSNRVSRATASVNVVSFRKRQCRFFPQASMSFLSPSVNAVSFRFCRFIRTYENATGTRRAARSFKIIQFLCFKLSPTKASYTQATVIMQSRIFVIWYWGVHYRSPEATAYKTSFVFYIYITLHSYSNVTMLWHVFPQSHFLNKLYCVWHVFPQLHLTYTLHRKCMAARLRPFNMNVAHKPTCKLMSSFTKHKDKTRITEKPNVIYICSLEKLSG
jgi:hypothetical protein